MTEKELTPYERESISLVVECYYDCCQDFDDDQRVAVAEAIIKRLQAAVAHLRDRD